MSSYNEDDTDPRSRNSSNVSDVDTAVEIQYLRSKFGALKGRISRFEIVSNQRIAALEKTVSEFRRKLIFVKGIMYGIFIAAGSGLWALFDKLKKLGVNLFQ